MKPWEKAESELAGILKAKYGIPFYSGLIVNQNSAILTLNWDYDQPAPDDVQYVEEVKQYGANTVHTIIGRDSTIGTFEVQQC